MMFITLNLNQKTLSFKNKLLKNFGHQAALTCGLENFKGDACILMDADFQDDPKYIKTLLVTGKMEAK